MKFENVDNLLFYLLFLPCPRQADGRQAKARIQAEGMRWIPSKKICEQAGLNITGMTGVLE